MNANASCTAILLAAGSGERLGKNTPKALISLAGKPMFHWSLNTLCNEGRIHRVIVAVPPGYASEKLEVGLDRSALPAEITFTEGGESRAESMGNAFRFVEGELVLVHDAARPLLASELLERLFDELEADKNFHGVIAAHPVTDTLKSVGESGAITGTVDRQRLWAAQTPQIFRRKTLLQALSFADVEKVTDDAGLLEQIEANVKVVSSSTMNFKITTQTDFIIAQHLLQNYAD